ncbi:hypothetical protein BU26DRAFT_603834 [Trematosphaeria pertusa]|uniref:Uncharacterized protein n=1 Tax=Trematosphaeria pertusa TaxID=390896 RepID=A0A6A6INK8_9PLEO|nr:uncharacterized protein BU26DRAFT_603834 [Trematosphaeria pertusa]KAF2251412.1 hypothetical protein BU26DRAFT_603834 [Trematosphaeria pertusa]
MRRGLSIRSLANNYRANGRCRLSVQQGEAIQTFPAPFGRGRSLRERPRASPRDARAKGEDIRVLVPNAEYGDLIGFMESLVATFSHWFFFITDEGGMGLVPAEHDRADGHSKELIVAFCGLPGLYLIRAAGKADTEFQLVGPCYMQGMMRGEFDYGDGYQWIALV